MCTLLVGMLTMCPIRKKVLLDCRRFGKDQAQRVSVLF